MSNKEVTITCPKCGVFYSKQDISAAFNTCPGCGWHYRMEPTERITYLTDDGSFVEFADNLSSVSLIGFPGYEEKLSTAQAKTRMKDAIVTGTCRIEGRPVILGIMSFEFMGGSMGAVVGEKINRAFLKGAEEKLPVLIYITSGGARMQEGIFSLMQMVKTSGATTVLSKAGMPYFAVLCDPTIGGVTASFAMLANVVMAEPGALIGYTSPRILEGKGKHSFPKGFQRAEFMLEKGFVDAIVPRNNQRKTISTLIDLHQIEGFSVDSSVRKVTDFVDRH